MTTPRKAGITRRGALGLAAAAALPAPAIAQSRIRLKFAGGGLTIFGYMPFFVATAQQLWQKHGIDPEVAMFPGGAVAMNAVLSGSSHIACGYYEHTIQMAAKGAKLTAFVLQTQNSGLVLGIRRSLEAEIRSPADLKGRKVGVSAPGSATHMFAMQYLAKNGLRPTDMPAVGVGTAQTALSAFERGDIDALSLFDPIIADLEQRGLLKILADARTTEGTRAIFGGPYAAGSLYGDASWVAKNPEACRAAAAAIQEAVAFLRRATPDQALGALEKGMCVVGQEVCNSGFTHNREAFEHDGAITPEMAETVKRMLTSFSPAIANASIDLGATYTNQYLRS